MSDARWIATGKCIGAAGAGGSAIYFDGTSSRRRAVTLAFSDRLEIGEDGARARAWSYADIRRADSPPGMLRVTLPDGAGAGAARDPRRRASPPN